MNNFDLSANDWDKNTIHTERSNAIAQKFKELIEFKPGMKAMEFGAGTAILSFLLADKFSSVTLIDNSQEMIRVCNEKINQSKSSHIKSIKIDLETEMLNEKYDIIYSQMAFHHINDVSKMINKFSGMLEENGILAVADLYTEDGSFHGEGFTGHKGFDPEWMATVMLNSCFKEIGYSTCFVQNKIDAEGNLQKYPVFLIIARKF
jgi:ubiquinone/menaquinone biosynthesis C-methylase UbiE